MNAINILNKYDTYKIASGMGGIFHVKLLEELPEKKWIIKIVSTNNDWEGKTYEISENCIKPLNRRISK